MIDSETPEQALSAHLLDQIATQQLQREPFFHARIENFFPDEIAEFLANTFPETGYTQSVSKNRHYVLEDMDLLESSRPTSSLKRLNSIWQRCVAAMNCDAYRHSVSELMEVDLASTTTKLRLCRYGPGHFMLPHTDQACRVVTQIIYLNSQWEDNWGGEFELLENEHKASVVRKYPPLFNSSILLKRSDTSYHAVAPVDKEVRVPRCSALFQYTY